MFRFTCDLCALAIVDGGVVCDMAEARVVGQDTLHPRLAERAQVLSIYVCRACAALVEADIARLRGKAARAGSMRLVQDLPEA